MNVKAVCVRILWGLVAVVVAVAPTAFADQTNYYYVSDGGGDSAPYGSWIDAATDIQTAVDEAHGDLGLGTNCIVLVSNGVYTLTSEVALRDGVVLRGWAGKDETVIDGGGVTRCVSINGAGTVLDGFTVSNGYANVIGYPGYGVGVICSNGVIMNCTITRNTQGQGYGAGVYIRDGMVTNCEISLNTGSLTGGRGGGLSVYVATVVDSVICSNQSKYGGGLYGNSTTIRDCEFSYNYASSQGGGGQTLGCTWENCLIIGNQSAINYGGLHLSRNEDMAMNCTIVGNQAATYGGVHMPMEPAGSGLYPSAVNTIVWGNQAGGVDSNITGSTNDVKFCCSPDLIDGVDDNLNQDPQFTAWNSGYGYGNSHVRGDYTLKLSSPCVDSGTSVGAPDRDLDRNARPEDGDGDTNADYDMGCYEAPDAGSGPLTCGFTPVPTEGVAPLQVGFTATLGGDTAGAQYQWIFGDGTTNNWSSSAAVTNVYAASATPYQVILNVTNAAAEFASATNPVTVYAANVYVWENGGHVSPFDTWTKAATNIQDAVDVAGAGYSIVLITNGTIRLTSQVHVAKGITVRSVNGRDVTFVDGGYPQFTNRCFYVAHPDAVLDGLTISNGYAYSVTAGSVDTFGGGVYAATSIVQNCTITLNRGGTSGQGAGIYASRATVDNCIITYNQHDGGAWFGGGVYASYCYVTNCIIATNGVTGTGEGGGAFLNYYRIDNCIITGNKAKYRAGGRMSIGEVWNSEISYNEASSSVGGMTLWYADGYNCLVIGNESGGGYGGVEVLRTSAEMHNSTVVGNKATSGVGGVRVQTTSSTVKNSIVYGNQGTTDSDLGGDTNNVTFTCAPELLDGVDGNVTGNPLFEKAGSGHGLTYVRGSYLLKAGSPCADTGSNQVWMIGAVDLAGEARVQGGRVNMGAYEYVVLPSGTLIMLN